ncbi:aldehyde dehydrogenase (NADP(+)) [Palleronia caenipelagi]|uniref:Aldehyde dehydrogenase (NADP(+)) n=1 Tax=Palleronia caenipelagi TaxID=2489174 RepID=A0A547PN29_9RHOB|nr:aldehyde dehydrogenase (NADP(+)) [Palleronia caenipelagi]TRD15558.1 aldehyde dehydrogenase (NADP(+)) [Palleronia caenipelagi]
MTFTPHGKHLIAGEWIGTEQTFTSAPANGPVHVFSVGTADLVDQAARAAEDAFWTYGYMTRAARADFLDAIAEEIEARAEAITEIGCQETGLPEVRLNGERGRTTGQLRLFADHIRIGEYLDRRYDEALPERQPLPRPDLRAMQRPVGPVAVFGASNFPLAFSTAGGDTAAALAAGCPVVFKGHDAHPGTGEIVAEAIHAAILECGLPAGVFSLVQGGTIDVGQALVQHSLIKAVGFTGSLSGGRALFDLCAHRDEPIPFFGELGSVNPMFMLPEALANRGTELGQGWAGSLTMGAGQFCTNPGIAVVIAGAEADAFVEATRAALSESGAQVMLTEGIAAAYANGASRVGQQTGVQDLLTSMCDRREAKPFLFRVTARDWIDNHVLAEEVFGPLGMVVVVQDADEMLSVARSFTGQLTATLHLDDADAALGRRLMPVLERKAGRVLANGFPTGVEVSDSMVHGGPYPASTNFGATSVGTLSIRRFLRPVCYQNIPAALLPADLARAEERPGLHDY